MSEQTESSALGPCGWPYRQFDNDGMGCVNGVRIDELLQSAERIGDVTFSFLQDAKPVSAYAVKINGKTVRFAFEEIQNGRYVVASNDAEVSVEEME